MGSETLGHGRHRRRLLPISSKALLVAAVAAVMFLLPYAGTANGDVELTGRVVEEHGDDFDNNRTVDYKVLETAKERYTLEGEKARGLRAGQQVRVRGVRRGGTLVLGANSSVVVTREAAFGGNGGDWLTGDLGIVAASTAAIQKRVAVLLVNFQGLLIEPWTASQVRAIYFTNTKSSASYFNEVSNGRISVTGEVYGFFTLANSTATCDYNGWATSARAAASAAGVDIPSFTNYVYAFPKVEACSWGGLGSVNGPHSWINGKGKMNLFVATHELGHNLGSHHAATMSCTSAGVRVAMSSTCTTSEYGDPFDIMGGAGSYSNTFHVNSFGRRQIGAVTTADQVTVTANGNYYVANAQAAGGSPRVLRVLRPAGDYFYLEHRRPYGLFDTFASTTPVVNGISIRLAPNTTRTLSRLIDTTPETTSFSDAALLAGRTFTDPTSGISVMVRSINSSGATLRIQVGPDTVAPTAPGSLAATVTGATSIGLSWTAATDDLEVSSYRVRRNGVQIGTTTGLSFSNTGLAQGVEYEYSVAAVDSTGNVGPAATVKRFLPDTVAPSAPGTVTAKSSGYRKVTVSWGAASDNVGVTGYRVFRNGTQLTTTPNLTIDDTAVIDGYSYTYSVRAVDAAGNVGASASAPQLKLADVTPPTAPGATAPITGTTARVEWTAASDNVAVTGYRVSRGGVVRATLSASARSFSESLPAGTYTYEIRAFDAAGNQSAALVATATVSTADTTPPSVPQGLTGTPQNNRYVQLSWQASTDDRAGTISYRVFRNGTAIGTKQTTLTYTDRPSSTGTYSYQVRAIDAAGNKSALSPKISVQVVETVTSSTVGVTVPQGLTGQPMDNFLIKLTWQPSTSSVSGTIRYRVFRNGVAIGTKQTSTTFYDQRLKANTFKYQVRAIDAAGNKSALSPAITVSSVKTATSSGSSSSTSPDTTPPSVPQGLKAEALGYRYVKLTWQASTDDRAGTIYYRVFRNGSAIGTRQTGLTFTDRPASAGTYRYQVRAIDAAGNKSKLSPIVYGQAIKGPL